MENLEIAVQLNGKYKGSIIVSDHASKDEITNAAKEFLEEKQSIGKVVKEIYLQGRFINIVAKKEDEDEQNKVWSDAFDEAFEKEYNIIYEMYYDEEYKRLIGAGYVEDEAKKAAHGNVHDIAVSNAGCKATDIANAVLDEWRK